MTAREVASGEVLFSIGDDGDTVFLIEEGSFDVLAPTTDGTELIVGQLGPSDVVGEITAVIGGRRSATVRASSAARVLELQGDAFEHWLAENPDQADRIASFARARMDRTRVARVVADLVGPDQHELIDEMTDAVEWVTIEAGEFLFSQGDIADAAYILVGGQMRIIAVDEAGETTLDTRIGRGDLLGEMGIIEQAPRMASALAIRDCTLAKIPKDTFEQLTAKHPSLMLPLVRKVLARVGDRANAQAHAGTIAIVVTDPRAPRGLVETMAEEIGRFGSTLHLDTTRVERFLNRRDITHASRGSAGDMRLIEFLNEVDVAHTWVVLECDAPDSDWSRRALRSADRVAIVASAHPDPSELRSIAQVRDILEATGDFDLWAVVSDAEIRGGAGARIRETTGASRSLHLRRDDERSIRRIGRLVSGNGVGVAFSGGGARSFGQIGAMRAMHELGLDVDAVAGTSMGSVIAAFAGTCEDPDDAVKTALELFTGVKLLDYTLPLSSIFAAKRMTDEIDAFFGGIDIEDLRLPYLCVSTNLTRATRVEHRRGDLVHAMRASVSLPGVFPPVPMDGDLLVDGGVLENLPARPLRRDPAVSTVIAIDVAPPDGPRARSDYGLALSGFDIVRRRLRRDKIAYPPLAHTVIASMLVGSSRERADALENDDIDLYMSLNLSGVKLLDFEALRPAIERGYEDALPRIEAWLNGAATEA